MSTNTVKVKCAYDDTNFTRVYQFDDVADSQLSSVKSGILTVNRSLSECRAGTSQLETNYLMRAAFISDDYDASENVGYLKEIVEAEIITVNETKIPLF